MAEFQEVMRQFVRMCCHYQRKCKCPMGCPMDGVNISQCRKVAFEKPEVTEKTVMTWAAQHPVVYPTWAEWLIKIGGAVKKLYAQQYHYKAAQPTQLIEVVEVLDEPIPADIAQKLGIEPKEG